MHIGDLFPEILNEAHWTDMYPDEFQKFRTKYLKELRKGGADELYVQFTNYSKDPLERNGHESPDHSDPVGVYGYPIKYVLTHPADIWYGKSAKYMRVLRAKPGKTLYINSITEHSVLRHLNSMGFTVREIHTMLDIINKHFKDRMKGTNKFGKILLFAVQHDLLKDPIEITKKGMFSKGGPMYAIRTGLEQSALFKKAGFDTIIDDAKTNTSAVINDREPQQAIFLTRYAFDVVETFYLRPGSGTTFLVNQDLSEDKNKRALVAGIAKAMDDQISEYGNDEKKRAKIGTFYEYYWTKKGRRINVSFKRPDSYYQNKKMGEKKHKEDKLHDANKADVTINTEYGVMQVSMWEDETFADVVKDVRNRWAEMQKNPIDNNWKPESLQSHHDGVISARDLQYAKEREAKLIKVVHEWDTDIYSTAVAAGHKYGINFPNLQTAQDKKDATEFVDNLSYHCRRLFGLSDAQIMEKLPEKFNALHEFIHLYDTTKDVIEFVKKTEELIIKAHQDFEFRRYIGFGTGMYRVIANENP